MEFNFPTDRPQQFSYPRIETTSDQCPGYLPTTILSCTVLSVQNLTNCNCNADIGELDRKRELVDVHICVCVNIILHYYTNTYIYTNCIQYVCRNKNGRTTIITSSASKTTGKGASVIYGP